MSWKKKGLIFQPSGEFGWMISHAQVPTVHVMEDRFRVFFSTRNSVGKSLTACIDLDKNNPSIIKQLYNQPVLDFGMPGTFDDDGVMPSYALQHEHKLYLYYSGWNQRVNVPYHNAMGLAVSQDEGLSFTRLYEGPIMDRIKTEPYLAVTPSVYKDKNSWKMWYVSGIRWQLIEQKYEPVYVIKYAHSTDGVNWERPNLTCIEQAHENEAFSHPNVVKIDDTFHMWFCCRDSHDYRDGSGSYKIGYATSFDGMSWQRKDAQAGISPAEEGWDSKMICYPYVVKLGKKLMMFYNGNSFGKSGFGYAIWE